MTRTKKTASVRKAGKGRGLRRGRVQARTASTAAKPRRVATRARAGGAPRTGSPYNDAVRGLQEAAASLADRDIIEILSDLSWPSRAKWLSSYFEDRLPEELVAGSSWLRANLGAGTIDLDALDGLPGYQAIAESLERVRGEPSAD